MEGLPPIMHPESTLQAGGWKPLVVIISRHENPGWTAYSLTQRTHHFSFYTFKVQITHCLVIFMSPVRGKNVMADWSI